MQAPSGAPFPGPPGLDDPKADVAVKAAAAQAAAAILEEKLTQLGLGAPETSQFIEEIKAVIDSHVAGKADELRAWGQQMMGQMNRKMKEKTATLSEEVAFCRERQARLEAENEQLKEVLQHLAGRFQVLATMINSKVMADPLAAAMAAESPARAAAVAVPPPGLQAGVAAAASPPGLTEPDQEPSTAAGPDQAAGIAALPDMGPATLRKMAEIPPFPFPGTNATVPLSLAEALSTQVPQQQRTQLSLATSLSPVAAAAPEVAPNAPGQFTFTLRKADGADLGLDVSHSDQGKTLRIEGVRPEGAVEAWNRQCNGGVAAEKVVREGDKLVSVNNVSYDPDKMLQECTEKQLLKLTIVRGDWVPKVLRAEASVFVPQVVEPPRSPERAMAKGEGEAESTTASSLQASPESPKPEAVGERV